MAIQSLIADIEEVERELETRSEPGADFVPLMVPMPTYKALSDAAAQRGMTIAQLIARAFKIAIEER